MAANPRIGEITYLCNSCKSELRRKETEPFPRACSYCHADNPTFTNVTAENLELALKNVIPMGKK